MHNAVTPLQLYSHNNCNNCVLFLITTRKMRKILVRTQEEEKIIIRRIKIRKREYRCRIKKQRIQRNH